MDHFNDLSSARDVLDLRCILFQPAIYSTSLGDIDNRMNVTIATLALKNPVGLAVDWISDKLYVVDLAAKRIDVMELDGRYRAIVISQNLSAPLAIALDPLYGGMFISDRLYLPSRNT